MVKIMWACAVTAQCQLSYLWRYFFAILITDSPSKGKHFTHSKNYVLALRSARAVTAQLPTFIFMGIFL